MREFIVDDFSKKVRYSVGEVFCNYMDSRFSFSLCDVTPAHQFSKCIWRKKCCRTNSYELLKFRGCYFFSRNSEMGSWCDVTSQFCYCGFRLMIQILNVGIQIHINWQSDFFSKFQNGGGWCDV